MPALTLDTTPYQSADADILIVGVHSAVDLGDLAAPLALLKFKSEDGKVVVFPSGGLTTAPVVIAVGVPNGPSNEQLRRAVARGIRAAAGATTVAVSMHPADVSQIAAIVEGVELGTYRFDRYKSKRPGKSAKSIDNVLIVTPFINQARKERTLERTAIVTAAVNQARDWVNSPPGDLRPPEFARQISDYVPESVTVSVWDEQRLAQERCGGILGVGRGSDAPPRLVRLSYSPANADKHLALVGKGITFDSGGLSIKGGPGMQTMKLDMAGAAAIVAATAAIAELELPIKITAFACIAENMPDGGATRPGDVLTIRDGQTVEVLNTDAEGRLVLADGLSLAVEAEPDFIIDVATLTGACMIALGTRTTGVFSNNNELAEQVLAASRVTGEEMWPLPMPEEIRSEVKSSDVADLRQHNPKSYGGALFAAAFLSQFVGRLPWVHLDIAGPSFNDSCYDYTPAGGSGVGVRTLVQLAGELTRNAD